MHIKYWPFSAGKTLHKIEKNKLTALRNISFHSFQHLISHNVIGQVLCIWCEPPKKAVTNLNSILKSRDIILPTKVHVVKTMFFPVVMCGCETWTIKKAECWRIDAFELWCWRRLFRVPWTARRSNQSILKEISPEYTLEGLILKLKLQYFGHLMRRTDSLEKPWCWEGLKAGGEGDDRGWDGWMVSLTQWTWFCSNFRK